MADNNQNSELQSARTIVDAVGHIKSAAALMQSIDMKTSAGLADIALSMLDAVRVMLDNTTTTMDKDDEIFNKHKESISKIMELLDGE